MIRGDVNEPASSADAGRHDRPRSFGHHAGEHAKVWEISLKLGSNDVRFSPFRALSRTIVALFVAPDPIEFRYSPTL